LAFRLRSAAIQSRAPATGSGLSRKRRRTIRPRLSTAVKRVSRFHLASRIISHLDGTIATHELNCEYTPYVWNGERAEGLLSRVVAGSVLFDLADRPIGISNGVETPTWIIDKL